MNQEHHDHDPSAGDTDQAASAEVAASADYESFVLIRVIDGLLGSLKGLLSPSLVHTSCSTLARLGMWAVLLFAAITLVTSIVIAAQSDSFSAMLAGLVSAVVVLGLLYTAGKFCNAGQRIIESTPTQLSSSAFLDSIALLSIALAVGSVILGISTATDTESLYPLGIGVGVGAWWFFLAAVAFHPQLANCSVRTGASAGEECIGIVAFLIKAMLRLVPIVFGVAVITGTVLYIITFIRYIAADESARRGSSDDLARLFEVIELSARPGIFNELLAINGFINSAAALPLAVYLGALLILLLIDVIRAILRIPGSD